MPFPSDAEVARGRRDRAARGRPRRESDGERLGLLKLVAGLTGVGLDTLVQRDAQRRIRRVTAVTLAALFAAIVMGLLTLVAMNRAPRRSGNATKRKG